MNDGLARGIHIAQELQRVARPLKRPRSPALSTPAQRAEIRSSAEQDKAAKRVFVSWAHSGEGWSPQQSAAWSRDVVEFATILRRNGVDAELDLFHLHESEVDWTRFGPQEVQRADYVVIAVSEAWAQRWTGNNTPTVGAGAVGEADALKGLFQQDQSAWQRKVLLAVLPSQQTATIPPDLARISRFTVDPDSPDSIETLLRVITAQPLYEKPDLGEVPALPPALAASLQRGESDGEYADYSAIRDEVEKEKAAAGRRGIASERLSVLMGLLDALNQ